MRGGYAKWLEASVSSTTDISYSRQLCDVVSPDEVGTNDERG